MNPFDVLPGTVVEGREGEHVLVLHRDGPTPCGFEGRILGGPDLLTGRECRVLVRPGETVEVIELPARSLVFAARRDGLVLLWDEDAGTMAELPVERVAGGGQWMEPGSRVVVRLHSSRPVWVDRPAES